MKTNLLRLTAGLGLALFVFGPWGRTEDAAKEADQGVFDQLAAVTGTLATGSAGAGNVAPGTGTQGAATPAVGAQGAVTPATGTAGTATAGAGNKVKGESTHSSPRRNPKASPRRVADLRVCL